MNIPFLIEIVVSDDEELQTLLEDLIEDERANQIVAQNIESNRDTVDGSAFPHLYPPQYYRHRKTRRLSNNPNYMPGLRILRRDIRRRYAEMFVNVINSHDLPLLIKFVQEFCRPDCRFLSSCSQEDEAKREVKSAMSRKEFAMVANLDAFIQGFAVNFVMMPDSMFTLSETQVRVKQGWKGSFILAKGYFRGTKLFTLEPVNKLGLRSEEEQSYACEAVNFSDDSLSVEGTCCSSDDLSSVSSSPRMSSPRFEGPTHVDEGEEYRWVRIAEPVEAGMESYISMTLNEKNQIERFHLTCEKFYEKPVSSSKY